jgi:phospholipid/cholesterol/gamma-HCH transport system permease protein
MIQATESRKFDFLVSIVSGVGHVFLDTIRVLGLATHFFWQSLRTLVEPPSRMAEIMIQIEFIGNKSVFIICLTSLFTGMVFALQTFSAFKMVRAEAMVGASVALAMTRELAPVLTGLIVTGRAGAAMAAQLGTMRVTEQIDALEVMGVNPKQYLILPRLVAAFVAMPLLCGVFDLVSNLGAFLLSTNLLGVDPAIYLDQVNIFIRPKDVSQGLIKSAVFGLIFSLIGTYKGFNATNGARGVGQATNESVVQASILILVSDYFLSSFIRWAMYNTNS